MKDDNLSISSDDYSIDTLAPIKSNKQEFWSGARTMFPFLPTVIAMGIIGGVYGINSGLNFFQTLGLAMAVNSGTVQFISIKLFQEKTTWFIILLTSIILNLRLIIYSAILRNHIRSISHRWRVIIGFGLIDAVFFIVNKRLNDEKDTFSDWKWYYFGASAFMYTNWMLATVVGIVLGSSLPNLLNYGLDFPMTAIFTAMLASTLGKNWKIWITVITAGVLSIVFRHMPYSFGLLIASLCGAIIGYLSGLLETNFLKDKRE